MGPEKIMSDLASDTDQMVEIGKFVKIEGIDFNSKSINQLDLWAKNIIVEGKENIDVKSLVDFLSVNYSKFKKINWKESIINGEITEIFFPDTVRWKGDTLDLSFCPVLKRLFCKNNKLSELNLSNVQALEQLVCSENRLKKLHLADASNLAILVCDSNEISELDLSRCTNLVALSCDNNQLSRLDLSKSSSLNSLFCSNNQLTELDLSYTPDLARLGCDSNWLTGLDLSHTSSLTQLFCFQNEIEELDLSKTPELDFLSWGVGEDNLIKAVFGIEIEAYEDAALKRGLTFIRSQNEYEALKVLVSESLTILTPREESLLRMRFGIGRSNLHTVEELGQALSICRSSVEEIQSGALRKLKHSIYSRQLKGFVFDRVIKTTQSDNNQFVTSFDPETQF